MKKILFETSGKPIEITDLNIVYDTVIKNFDNFSTNGCGSATFYIWEDDVNTRSLRIGTVKNYGIYLTHEINYKKMSRIGEITTEHTHLAVYDKTKLEEVIDVYDEIYASVGLFFPPEIAWKGIKEFMVSGGMSLDIEWILAESIPENGNWC